jgi:hypothetical protein
VPGQGERNDDRQPGVQLPSAQRLAGHPEQLFIHRDHRQARPFEQLEQRPRLVARRDLLDRRASEPEAQRVAGPHRDGEAEVAWRRALDGGGHRSGLQQVEQRVGGEPMDAAERDEPQAPRLARTGGEVGEGDGDGEGTRARLAPEPALPQAGEVLGGTGGIGQQLRPGSPRQPRCGSSR